MTQRRPFWLDPITLSVLGDTLSAWFSRNEWEGAGTSIFQLCKMGVGSNIMMLQSRVILDNASVTHQSEGSVASITTRVRAEGDDGEELDRPDVTTMSR